MEITQVRNAHLLRLPSCITDLFMSWDSTGPDSDGLPKDGVLPGNRSQIFFGKVYPKLQVIKKKYDPEQVFNRWYPITPA